MITYSVGIDKQVLRDLHDYALGRNVYDLRTIIRVLICREPERVEAVYAALLIQTEALARTHELLVLMKEGNYYVWHITKNVETSSFTRVNIQG